MSLLPITRMNSLLSMTSNGGSGSVSSSAAEIIPGAQDEDILLVDFQPVMVPNNHNGQLVLSSPTTVTAASASAVMYPLPPPVGQLPGAHMVGVGMNHHPHSHPHTHPSVSSDGVTTPISATGSSGKGNSINPNNFPSLVNSSNHIHLNNNTSRSESDFNYTGNQQLQRSNRAINNAKTSSIIQLDNDEDDEEDEFARHQALAQPSYMTNKRRSRRFQSRENHNHIWDNGTANHTGFHHQPHMPPPQPQHMSSSLSSSEDSDTGFLMGTRKTAYTRKSVQRVVDPHPMNSVGGGGGNGSPSASTVLLPNLGNRKRVRRKRPSARNRKPVNAQHDKMNIPSDMLSMCCCWCQDDHQGRTHNRALSASSIRNRYLRFTCFIVVIIVMAVLTSITLSLQRKIDSLGVDLNKLDQAVGSPLASESAGGSSGNTPPTTKSIENLFSSQNLLNATVVNLKGQLDQVLSKLEDLQTKVNQAASKPDGVAEVKGALAKLGSRVEDLSATLEKLQAQSKPPTDNGNNDSNANQNQNPGSGGSSNEPQQS